MIWLELISWLVSLVILDALIWLVVYRFKY